jgi:hypothetical protein
MCRTRKSAVWNSLCSTPSASTAKMPLTSLVSSEYNSSPGCRPWATLVIVDPESAWIAHLLRPQHPRHELSAAAL